MLHSPMDVIIVSQRLFTAWREEELDNVCQCVPACVRAWLSCPACQTVMVGQILQLFFLQVTVMVR